MNGTAADDFRALDAEIAADAIDILDDLLSWELVWPRWDQVGQILDTMAVAAAANDIDTFRELVVELELASPGRATRIGATPVVPAPEPVRDRRNHLVHSLQGTSAPPPGDGTNGSRQRGGGDGQRPAG